MSHPQRQSSAKRNLEKTTNNESSTSSSFHKPDVEGHLHEHQTSSTNNKPSNSSFNSKFLTSLSHQLDREHNGLLSFPCIFNLSLRRWTGFKQSFCRKYMAANGEVSTVHIPSRTRKKKHGEQKKIEELEGEVAMLQKMLNHEERVHEILERAHRQNGSALHIPNSLPPKMKELLAELAMVEDEIVRLEGQVSQLKIVLKREKELTKETKSRQWHGTSGSSQVHSVVSPKESIPNFTNKAQERVAFDTKAMHFISKAIKGGFSLDDFSPKNANKKDTSDLKDNQLEEEAALQPIAGPRKSAALNHKQTIPPSPLRDPRHPTPLPRRDRELNVTFNLPLKPLPLPAEAEENNPKWQQPNKLSESIMKCLIFIFVRILRTARAMELEKSGPVSRSIHSSFSSRSFRVDSNLNSKASLMIQRDSRQQDPYGIFDVEESVPRDIGPYKNLVIFSSNSMDPKCLSSSSFNPLLRTLSGLLGNLQKVNLKVLSHQQKLAFWINMYNACIMHGYLQYGVPSSPEKLLKLMNKATLNIGGNVINAQAIEHFILRKPAGYKDNAKDVNDDKGATVRQLYGLEIFDPNITFALCCGTRSSPSVRIFTGENVVTELEKAKLEYLQASVLVTTRRTIGFPELLLRNMSDFAEDTDLLVKWVCHQLPTSGTLRKSLVECFRGHSSGKISAIVDKILYDFEFQYLLANISSP